MSTFQELVYSNRSFRGFDPSVSVSREDLLYLVDLARVTASSVNKQPLKYYLAYDPDAVSMILAETRWAGALKDRRLPEPGKGPTAFIVICHDTSVAPEAPTFLKDVGIVAQTMLLGASERGLGGCMIGNFHPEKLRETLSLDASMVPKLCVALGKPAETVVLTDVGPDGDTTYYRDESDVHHVPKRSLSDIVLD